MSHLRNLIALVQMFKSWMVLSTGCFIIHCIMQLDFLILNYGKAIYPVDSAIQLLNNLASLRIKFWARLPTAQQDFSSTRKFSDVSLIFTLFIINFSFPYIIFFFGPWGKLFPTKETCIIKVVLSMHCTQYFQILIPLSNEKHQLQL